MRCDRHIDRERRVEVGDLGGGALRSVNRKSPARADLKGLPVMITVVDPWEFIEEHGYASLAAAVVAACPDGGDREKALLLKLRTPLSYAGADCQYLVAVARGGDDRFLHLLRGEPVDCALTSVPEDQAMAGKAFDPGWWRVGVALLASLRRETSMSGRD